MATKNLFRMALGVLLIIIGSILLWPFIMGALKLFLGLVLVILGLGFITMRKMSW